jgi:vesicle-associated membrane protein 7
MFHYIVENGITYLCMCDEDQSKRMPYAFLHDVKVSARRHAL